MGFFRKITGSPTQKSWWPALSFLLFFILFFAYGAITKHDSATRQKTSVGTIGECEVRGRGHVIYCHYTFSVGSDEYVAVNEAKSDAASGQTVTVYYDSQDPTISALENFSEQSRDATRSACVFLFVFVAAIAFVLWDRTPYPQPSEQPTAQKQHPQ